MKKTLFSLAFVAASGVYVAAANHVFRPPEEGVAAVTMDTALPVMTPPLVAEPVVSIAPIATPTQMALAVPPQIIADASVVALPPLPRSRPLATVSAGIEPAASTTVAPTTPKGLRDGTYTGTNENAYYGRVQVEVTVAGHQITRVKVLDYPQDRRTSRYINSQALPILQQEVMTADSANVDTVSGATLTSEAYIRSLGNALVQAGGSNA